jgi:hypothetical protein
VKASKEHNAADIRLLRELVLTTRTPLMKFSNKGKQPAGWILGETKILVRTPLTEVVNTCKAAGRSITRSLN